MGSINKSRTDVDWITFEDALTRTKNFGSGLAHFGLKPQDTFGIYSANTPEYSISEYGCYRQSIIVIPIYETLGSNVCAFISKQGFYFYFYSQRLQLFFVFLQIENL